MSFTRTIEDFVCENCGHEVAGNGYTNHCPSCLWSKHVDIDPGDREAECKGLMEPVGVVSQGQEYVLIHRCVKCGFTRRNKTTENDSRQALIDLSARA